MSRPAPAGSPAVVVDRDSHRSGRSRRAEPGAASTARSSTARSSAQVLRDHGMGAQHVLLRTGLGRRLQELGLGGALLEALLAHMEQVFGAGAAYALAADTPWVLDWARWELFAVEVVKHGPDLGEVLLTELRDLLFALSRIHADNVQLPERTNDEALADLVARGFVVRRGRVWEQNQCLADSLLQLLVFHGLVDGDVDREALCALNRVELESNPVTVPRNRSGELEYGGSCSIIAMPRSRYVFSWHMQARLCCRFRRLVFASSCMHDRMTREG